LWIDLPIMQDRCFCWAHVAAFEVCSRHDPPRRDFLKSVARSQSRRYPALFFERACLPFERVELHGPAAFQSGVLPVKYMLRLLVVLSLLSLAGCVTPYAASGWTGGYQDQQISANSYRVTFTGNGNTSKDMVWNYWIYRCAQLTQQKGFEIMVLVPDEKKKTSSIDPEGRWQPAVSYGNDDFHMVKTHHGGGGYVTHYTYVPGGAVTSYHSSGIIVMFHESDTYNSAMALRAQPVLDALKPYVDSAGKTVAPTRADILKNAMVIALPKL
jgi:hypothetical protein